MLHLAGGIQGVVRRREGSHYFIADRFDDGALMRFCCRAHDVHAGENHVASAKVAHHLIDVRTANDVGKQNG
jgi:hypothetical protein